MVRVFLVDRCFRLRGFTRVDVVESCKGGRVRIDGGVVVFDIAFWRLILGFYE